ncbi:dihydroorotase [Williamsoniiplasma lucivorax]|uniref:Dihydroorotase n=1 Tax=Williamsoniiplasma lucivorax TaxID=209274 RepID=A0A2S5R9X9_9MOLU|nr:dihydroorotase [Williamsoniiplasma lucivorax]PPE04134.1 dihydroorotase [Williamsoniiplasma lucivorax]
MSILLKKISFIEDRKLVIKDILIEGELISKIQNVIEPNATTEVIECQNFFLTPGLIDVHTHTRTPGFEYKEDLHSFNQAALHGGVTIALAMANTNPIPDNPATYQMIQKLLDENSVIKIYQMGAVTNGLKSVQLVDFKAMKQVGANWFSNDGFGIQNTKTMNKILKEMAKNDVLISTHLETEAIKEKGMVDQTSFTIKHDIPTFDQASEYLQLGRDLELLKGKTVRYHAGHISTKEAVDLIRQAKMHGINITCEVTPNHLLLTSEIIQTDNGIYKINPPLRSETDRLALLVGLQDGTIDCIATDHAPHAIEEKNQPISDALFGMVGIEFAFSLMYTHLVKTGILSMVQLLDKMHTNPNHIFRLNANDIKVGASANLVVWDLNKKYKISKKTLQSKQSNTPFLEQEVYGENQLVIIKGTKVFGKEGK